MFEFTLFRISILVRLAFPISYCRAINFHLVFQNFIYLCNFIPSLNLFVMRI